MRAKKNNAAYAVKLIIVAMCSLAMTAFFAGNETYAENNWDDCLTGGGYIHVSSSVGTVNKLGDLAGGDKQDSDLEGSAYWACSALWNNRGLLFVANDVTEYPIGNGLSHFYIDLDVQIDLNKRDNTAYAVGMIHYARKNVKATRIGYCIAESGCRQGMNAGGIITKFDSEITREVVSENPPRNEYGGWTAPIYKSVLKIDGVVLKEKWDSIEKEKIRDDYYMITLYQRRCWNYEGSCSVNPIYIFVETGGDPGGDPPTCDNAASGQNSGKSGVRKNGGSFAYTNNNSGAVSTWAKPGDSIQFTHETCAAAQKIVDENSDDIGGNDANYTVTASSSYGNGNSGYLFGNDLRQGISATISNSKLRDNDYAYTVNSPSDDAGDAYDCANNKSGSFFSGHYSIPSIASSSNCKSAQTTRLSDAGNTITQIMSWRDYRIGQKRVLEGVEKDGYGNITNPGYYRNVRYIESSTDYSTSASVYIPYNYILKPYVEGNKNDAGDKSQTATIGGKYDVTAYVPVDVRKNKQVGDTYATSTKDTKIKVVSFVLDSNSQPTSNVTYHANNGSAGADSICKYATASGNVKHCANIVDETVTLNQNTSGNLSGTLGNKASISEGGSKLILDDGIEASVPKNNISLGDKICVAVATWPSDSHNLGDAATVDSYDQSIALTNSAGSNAKWAVSAPSCAAITKRPIFSVESSQLSATGTITSSTYTRDRLTFSSWAEYSIATSKENGVKDTASGAATTYINALNLNSRYYPNYAIASREVNLASTSAGTKSINTFTAQTMLNSGNGSPGNATTLELAENIEKFYTSIENIYTRKGKTEAQSGAGIASFNELSELNGSKKLTVKNNYYDLSIGSSYACVYDEDKGYYVAYGSDATLGKNKKGDSTAPYYCLSNGSKYYHVKNANAYIGGGGERNTGGYTQFRLTVNDLDGSGGQETFRNQTTVIHVEGTAVIDTNFVIAYNYGGRMLDYFTNIQQIPQVIIIADNIDITNNVSRIDAWLIAKNKINTCAYDNYAGFIAGNYIESAANGGLNANRCNKELVINGPVVASEIALNRTAGAGTTPAEYYSKKASLAVEDAYYVQRGEIFNLRSDAYLWAYYQAQRNGILTTVYSKELPTRY